MFQRESLKALLRPLVRWEPIEEVRSGFSIVLGTPWALRHLLEVNLEFVARTDLEGLDRLFVVFDRIPQPGGAAFCRATRERFPSLPLDLSFHPPAAGRLVGWINQSKFYASLNWVTGIARCRTRYAVLHDFDLYPLTPEYFQAIVRALADQEWRFSGAEYTYFDGLTDRDGLIGTWTLGLDAAWLRKVHAPIACFHGVEQVAGRRVDLDAFSGIQSRTPARGLAPGVTERSYAHVKNLCSTYLRFMKGEAPRVAWRLHYLWYLEWLTGCEDRLRSASRAMREASSPWLTVEGRRHDFSNVHVTCANVLQRELELMERFLHGSVREDVGEFVAAFRDFLSLFGQSDPIPEVAGAALR